MTRIRFTTKIVGVNIQSRHRINVFSSRTPAIAAVLRGRKTCTGSCSRQPGMPADGDPQHGAHRGSEPGIKNQQKGAKAGVEGLVFVASLEKPGEDRDTTQLG